MDPHPLIRTESPLQGTGSLLVGMSGAVEGILNAAQQI
jgi:hypothetical protein